MSIVFFRHLAFWLCLTLVVPILLTKPPYWPPIRSDGYGYHIWVRHIVRGDFDFCEEKKYPKPYSHTDVIVTPPSSTGRCGNIYPIGMALTQLPFFALPWPHDINLDNGSDPTEYEQYVTLLLPTLLLCASLLMITQIATKGITKAKDFLLTNFLLIFLVLGTGWFHYSTFDGGFSHAYSTFWVCLIAFLLTKKSRLTWAVIIPASAILFLTRNTNILLMPMIWAYSIFATGNGDIFQAIRQYPVRNFIRAIPLAVGTALGVLAQLSINHWHHGVWTISSYGSYGFTTNLANAPLVLLSYERGLLTWYPIVAIALICTLFNKRTFQLGLVLLVTFAAYTLLYAAWFNWFLGAGFGHRGFIEIFPILALGFLLSVQTISNPHLRQIIFITCLAISLWAFILMLGYWRNAIPYAGTTSKRYWNILRLRHIRPEEKYSIIFCSILLIYYSIRSPNSSTEKPLHHAVR